MGEKKKERGGGDKSRMSGERTKEKIVVIG